MGFGSLRPANCGTHDALHDHRPWLETHSSAVEIPMMGVVEVLPVWPRGFALSLLSFCIQRAELDDERSSRHHPFARVIREFHFMVASIRTPPSRQEAFAILARAGTQGCKVSSQSANIFDIWPRQKAHTQSASQPGDKRKGATPPCDRALFSGRPRLLRVFP